MSNSTNLLISGSGLGNPVVCGAWKHTAVVASVSVVCWLIFALYFHSQVGAYDSWYYIPAALGTGMTVLVFFLGYLVAKRIKTTYVNVFEESVSGMAVDKDFTIAKTLYSWVGWNKKRFMKLTGFDLAINQITSVSLASDHAVVINASGTNYKCFVSNGSEILDTINKKIQST